MGQRGTIHEAGEPINMRQDCIRCHKTLLNYAGTVSAPGDFKISYWRGTVTVYPGDPERWTDGAGPGADLCERP